VVSVAEVVVEAVPDGISDTTGELEDMEASVNESTESMSEQADQMSGLTESFQGAMGTAVAGLAVAAGGLLSQVPVLGEAFAGLNALVDAVAFQMDKVLRPVLTPLTNAFFGLAETIFEAEGAVGTAIGTIATIGTILATVGAAVGAAAVKIFGFAAVWGKLVAAAKIAVGVIGTAISVIGSLPAAVIGAIAALAAFAVAYLTNWRGVRDKTDAIVGEIVQFVKDGFGRLTTWFSNTWAANLISDAVEWGKGIIDSLIEGIRNGVGRLSDFVSGIEIAPGLTLGDVSGSVNLGGGGTGSGGSGGDFIGARGGGGNRIFLDGREIENNQGRYRKDALNRRG
jgi:phage-related protein